MGFAGVTRLNAQTWSAALWLIPIGVLAGLGQLCMTRAYNLGSTILVANLQYSAIVFASFYSLVLFGDQIPALGWVGMVLIIVSNICGSVLQEKGRSASAASRL
jgi:S-adenosylmethionine uptake transporter